MADQQYSLRWNNHHQNFITIFKDLLDFEELVDVTLSVEGKHIKAHKVVLSACSPYFKLLFSTTPCKHPIVIISDIKYSDLKTIIDFIYCGEISVYNEQLADLLEVAKTLEVRGLYDSNKNEHQQENVNGYSSKKIEQKPESNNALIDSNSGGSEHFVVHIDPEIQSYEQNYRGECVAEIDVNRSSQNYLVTNPLEVRDLYDSQKDGSHLPANVNGQTRTKIKQEYETNSVVDSNAGGSEPFIGHYFDTGFNFHEMKYKEKLSEPFATRSYENYPIGMESNVMERATQPIPDSYPYVPVSVSNSRSGRQRNIKVQNTENFLLALEAVRSGKLGFCKAAKFYGLNNRTLWLEYKKRGYPTTRPPVGLNRKLCKKQST